MVDVHIFAAWHRCYSDLLLHTMHILVVFHIYAACHSFCSYFFRTMDNGQSQEYIYNRILRLQRIVSPEFVGCVNFVLNICILNVLIIRWLQQSCFLNLLIISFREHFKMWINFQIWYSFGPWLQQHCTI